MLQCQACMTRHRFHPEGPRTRVHGSLLHAQSIWHASWIGRSLYPYPLCSTPALKKTCAQSSQAPFPESVRQRHHVIVIRSHVKPEYSFAELDTVDCLYTAYTYSHLASGKSLTPGTLPLLSIHQSCRPWLELFPGGWLGSRGWAAALCHIVFFDWNSSHISRLFFLKS
ncbi:hypothetical protein BDV98DRAFT_341798 [Pterulicium gracile]|uniref:Uncharacterized protein n=1 Tax=Pterulicium gracile TaxID=1884261 RepID=A0A5C3Q1S0_9AGAR|nr:hypothetical protein BDV98DRAFT_341798 [Pterula gracilis]